LSPSLLFIGTDSSADSVQPVLIPQQVGTQFTPIPVHVGRDLIGILAVFYGFERDSNRYARTRGLAAGGMVA
jgi:hypothetical protein